MQVRLSSGNYSILASGESFLFGPYEDLAIQIDDGNEFQIKIVMKFREDTSGEQEINTDVQNDSLVITCVNFSSMSTGLKRPAHIADVNGKKIYFMFSSSCLGEKEDKTRNVKYTVFWENKMKE